MRDPLAPLPWQIDSPLLGSWICRLVHKINICLAFYCFCLSHLTKCVVKIIFQNHFWYHVMMLDKLIGPLILVWNLVETLSIH